jgi:muconolactone delta-isomerase
MSNDVFQYMVEFRLPEVISERFQNRIPEQRTLVNRYFSQGKLVSYGVSLEGHKAWAVFNADTEYEVLELVRNLPLTRFMSYEIKPLTFYNLIGSSVPNFSVN